MKTAQLFRSYELLVDRADQAFREVKGTHGPLIRCEPHCSDCCHAVFGLFLVEAAYLKQQFDGLGEEEKKAALERCREADEGLNRLEKMLKDHEDDLGMQAYILARERIHCPLLDSHQECLLYPHRPITCRVYGIPTKIQGKAHVCGKAGFRDGETYPVFDLDGTYRDLHLLSREFSKEAGSGHLEKASLLISVSKAISTPTTDLLLEVFK